MILEFFKNLLLFVSLLLFQLLVLNNVVISPKYSYFFQPQLIIFSVLYLPVNLKQQPLLIISFLMGITYDMFFNTFGIVASVSTLIGFIRFYYTRGVENEMLARDDEKKVWIFRKHFIWRIIYYSIFSFIFYVFFLTIDNGFSHFFTKLLPAYFTNTIFTILLFLILENLFFKTSRN